MNLMFYHPQVLTFMGYKNPEKYQVNLGQLQTIDKAMFEPGSRVSRVLEDVSYAVADHKNHLVGWIWFCIDKRHPLPLRVARRFGLHKRNSRSYQVVYEKLLSAGWPMEILTKTLHVNHIDLHTERKGVIVEGLRLAIARLNRAYKRLYVRKHYLALYAYVLPDNIASQKVLQKNGFAKEDRQYSYDGLIHDLWVRVL
jgi:hypothetical protein